MGANLANEFHPDKCQVLTITRKKEPIHFDYVLHGYKLEHVQTAKYLGVTISHNMRWNTRVRGQHSKERKPGFRLSAMKPPDQIRRP